jgi:hypothetical protein
MTNDIIAARITRELPEAERSVDHAIAALSDLMATLARARAASDLPPSTGQSTIMRLAKAQMSIVGVSSDVLRVHGDLLTLAGETMSWTECPPDKALVGLIEKAA